MLNAVVDPIPDDLVAIDLETNPNVLDEENLGDNDQEIKTGGEDEDQQPEVEQDGNAAEQNANDNDVE